MTPQHDHSRQFPGRGLDPAQEGCESDNPVVRHLSVYKTRARLLNDAVVERKARDLQAASSFDDWDGLSDEDKELWRHMARLELC